MVPPAVEFAGVGKQFADGPVVLDHISISVSSGEFVSLIGPSGCGKSTLLRMAAGLTAPSTGTVRVAGEQPSSGSQRTAFVFQEPTLLPWLSVQQNVELPLRLARVPASRRAELVRTALDRTHIGAQAAAFPRTLSGGQRMRASVARAVVGNPTLLLLDEPFGALDEMTRERLNEELLAIRDQDRWTALFVTHSVAEAVFLSTRVLILAAHPGRIVHDLPIDLPFPRTAETRLGPEYHQLVGQASRALRSAQRRAG